MIGKATGEVVERTPTTVLTIIEVSIMIASTPSNFHSNRDDVGQESMTGYDVIGSGGRGSRNDAVAILGSGGGSAFNKVVLYSM